MKSITNSQWAKGDRVQADSYRGTVAEVRDLDMLVDWDCGQSWYIWGGALRPITTEVR